MPFLTIMVPGASGLNVFFTRTRMFLLIAGSIERGCITFAPNTEFHDFYVRDAFEDPGVVDHPRIDVMMPSTSVQIQISSASIPAPTMDAE